MILSEHVVRCDTDGKDFNTFWYQWTVGRLQQVFMAVNIFLPFSFCVQLKIHSIAEKSYSIMNRSRNTVRRWKLFSSRMIWIAIFSTLSGSFKPFAVNDKVPHAVANGEAFLNGFSLF